MFRQLPGPVSTIHMRPPAKTARHLSGRVPNARLFFGGSLHHLVRHGFHGIAGRDAVAPSRVHGRASLVVDAQDPIGLVAILFQRGAGEDWLDQ
jgi:hypothetical protein